MRCAECATKVATVLPKNLSFSTMEPVETLTSAKTKIKTNPVRNHKKKTSSNFDFKIIILFSDGTCPAPVPIGKIKPRHTLESILDVDKLDIFYFRGSYCLQRNHKRLDARPDLTTGRLLADPLSGTPGLHFQSGEKPRKFVPTALWAFGTMHCGVRR